MKNFKLLLLALLFSFGIHGNSNASLPFEIKEGTKLTYGVTAFGSVYDFIVEITSTENGLSFDWTMGNPINTDGKITITPEALENARAYHNYFSGGSDLTLIDKSSVFLSKEVGQLLLDEKVGNTLIDLGGGLKSYKVDEEQPTEVLHVDVNKRHMHLDMHIVYSPEDYTEVNFIQVGDYYLIANMRTNFHIILKEVNF